MKTRNRILIPLLFLACFFHSDIIFADASSARIHRIAITMKNGAVQTGYVWGPDLPAFNPQVFLSPETVMVLYKDFYPIHDNGYLNGFAYRKDEVRNLQGKDIEKISALPSQFKDGPYYFLIPLPKEEIDLMQNKLICSDRVDQPCPVGEVTLNAFNYDPKIDKRELHRILLEYLKIVMRYNRKNIWVVDEEAIRRKMGWEKIVFAETGYD